jgi:hypothetical protein
MGLHPWHFWRIAGAKVPIVSSCNPLTFLHPWQYAMQASRDDVTRALLKAERVFAEYAHFWPAPRFIKDTLDFPMQSDPRKNYLSSVSVQGEFLPIQLKYGHLRTFGAESYQYIASPSVAYYDYDGDGINETFGVTFPTSVADPEEIALYFSGADRFDGSAVSPRWQIEPIKVSIDGGVATVTGSRWLAVKPALQEGYKNTEIDEGTVGNFVSNFDVYRRYADTTNQGRFVWLVRPIGCYTCPDGYDISGDPSAYAVQVARFGARNATLGAAFGESAALSGSTYVTALWSLGYQPNKIDVYYKAGYPLDGGAVSTDIALIIARLAAAEIGVHVCGCSSAYPEVSYWQEDLAVSTSDSSRQTPFEMLGNPIGTRRGQVYAWQAINQLELARASLSA